MSKIIKQQVFDILNQVDVFDGEGDDESDPKVLIYVDFLDSLVRVAAHYPFPEESEEFEQMEEKLVYIVKKLEEKFGSVKEGFIKSLEQKDKDMNFMSKMVIDDESDMEGEYGEGEDDGEY